MSDTNHKFTDALITLVEKERPVLIDFLTAIGHVTGMALGNALHQNKMDPRLVRENIVVLANHMKHTAQDTSGIRIPHKKAKQ